MFSSASFAIMKVKKQERGIKYVRTKLLRKIHGGLNNSTIPQREIEIIARCIFPDIIAFYESEEGQREFAEWKAQQAEKVIKQTTVKNTE